MMNAKLSHQIIDRNDIIEHIKEGILNNPNKEFEISATDLAKKFGVQGPTMDYHLKKLLDEGIFVVSNKKGKYGRKMFILPTEKPVVNDLPSFKEMLLNKYGNQNQESQQAEEAKETEEAQNKIPDIPKNPDVHNTPKSEDNIPLNLEKEEIRVDEFALDSKIEEFLFRAKSIPSANQLISKTDKEILSVMAESIQQQQVYLKDLSNQLELMENLTLLHNLIDERDKMLTEMEQIRQEHKQLLEKISGEGQNVTVDPQRVRLMHQIIINTLDTFLDQPNHTLALQRKEFRNAISKEVSDLANYILGLEK